MKYSKKQIEQYSIETKHIKHYIEKVIRLLDILNYFFAKCSFKDSLVLKGGTAINLVHTGLKRLSVDIDLDYCGSLEREKTLEDRNALEEELDKYMISENYTISPKSRSSHALLSKIYRYENVFGNIDTIKVDINFMDRVHLYSPTMSKVNYYDKTVTVRVPAIEELFGMKINALIDRSKPRDLYDVIFVLENTNSFDMDMLRKAVVFYLSLNNKFIICDSTFERIKTIDYQDIKIELLPVLKKDERFNFETAKTNAINFLKELLQLTNKEKQYLEEFSKGNYDPSLLFDEQTATKVKDHPMAKWRAKNINN